MNPRTRWTLALVLAVLAVETLWFWDVLAGTHTLFTRDVLGFSVPHGAEAGRLWRAGQWPWWSERLGGGMPVFHHPSAEVASPLVWLYVLLEPLHAFGVQLWGFVVLASVGVMALARALRVRLALAAWAGVAWVACGPVASTWTVGHAARHAVLPWLAYAAVRAVRGQPGGVVLLAACTAWAWMFPDPLVLFGRAVVTAVVAWSVVPRRQRRRAGVTLTGAAVAGVLLAGPVVVPQAAVVMASAREGLTVSPRAQFSTASLLNSVAPGAAGLGGASGAGAGLSSVREETTANLVDNVFLGWLTVLLLLLMDRRLLRSRRCWPLLAAALALGVLSRGDVVPGTAWLWQFLGMRFPDKLLEPASLCLVLAAAQSGSRALRCRWVPRRAALVPLLGVALLMASSWVAPVLVEPLAQAELQQAAALELMQASFTFSGAIMVLLGLACATLRDRPRALEGSWVVLGALEMTLSMQALVLFTPTSRILQAPLEMTRPYVVGQRVLATARGEPLFAPAALDPTLEQNDLYGRLTMAVSQPHAPVMLGAAETAAQDFSRLEPRHVRLFFTGTVAHLDNARLAVLAQRLGAQRLVVRRDGSALHGGVTEGRVEMDLGAGGRWQDLDVLAAKARISAEHDARAQQDDVSAGFLLASPQGPQAVVAVDRLPQLDPQARLLDVLDRDGEQRFTVEAQASALVVVRGSFAPGWTVTVDGVDQALLRANIFQRAVLVPPGRHAVVMHYAPPGLGLGLAAACLGGLWLVALLWWRRRSATL